MGVTVGIGICLGYDIVRVWEYDTSIGYPVYHSKSELIIQEQGMGMVTWIGIVIKCGIIIM